MTDVARGSVAGDAQRPSARGRDPRPHPWRGRGVRIVFFALTSAAFACSRDRRGTAGDAGAPIAPESPSLDFSPWTHGFKFRNYGRKPGVENLGPAELRRMFGDVVCERIDTKGCVLTPVAEDFMTTVNGRLGVGHCEGFATLSLLLHEGRLAAPKDFALPGMSASKAFELELDGNERLQREIAYWSVVQFVEPASRAEIFTLSPSAVVATLRESFANREEKHTVAVYKSARVGGHSMVPFSVETRSGSLAWIHVYDSNFPGQDRHIEVDTAKDTWTYDTSRSPRRAPKPIGGTGADGTLTLTPLRARLEPLKCPFCLPIGEPPAAPSDIDAGAPIVAAATRRIYLLGHADLLIEDPARRRLGYVGGELLNEIPGSSYERPKTDQPDEEDAESEDPVYLVPSNVALRVFVDGATNVRRETVDLVAIGPGYSLAVRGMELDVGQRDEVELSADWRLVRYSTSKQETPALEIAIDGKEADYEFIIEVVGDADGQTMALSIDTTKGEVALTLRGISGRARYSVEVRRYERRGTEIFSHEGLALGDGGSVTFGYGAWRGEHASMKAIVRDAAGKIVRRDEEISDQR
jgi:hypothetical protein